jgi:hypothetical protein
MEGVHTEFIVLELAAPPGDEPEDVQSRFTDATAPIEITTLRRWSAGEKTYVVVHDPMQEVFAAVESAAGLRIRGATRLDLPADLAHDLAAVQALLPAELEQPIILPAASIPPPGAPWVVCPNCELRIHPPPMHPPRALASTEKVLAR